MVYPNSTYSWSYQEIHEQKDVQHLEHCKARSKSTALHAGQLVTNAFIQPRLGGRQVRQNLHPKKKKVYIHYIQVGLYFLLFS